MVVGSTIAIRPGYGQMFGSSYIMTDLLEIPAFLKRENATQPTRRAARKPRQETAYNPGKPVKRPTKAQHAALSKIEWSYGQIIRLNRPEAATIIKLGVSPEARFAPDKKHQFPDKKDD